MKEKLHNKIIHTAFDVGLILKTINALVEILIGFGLFFLTPENMQKIIGFIAKKFSFGFLQNLISNYAIPFGHAFSTNSQHFAIFYMLSHGILKLVVIIFLWLQKLWAYPISIIVFILFMAYQVFRFTHTHSILLILLTILDAFMIILTVLEYKRIKTIRNEKLKQEIISK